MHQGQVARERREAPILEPGQRALSVAGRLGDEQARAAVGHQDSELPTRMREAPPATTVEAAQRGAANPQTAVGRFDHAEHAVAEAFGEVRAAEEVVIEEEEMPAGQVVHLGGGVTIQGEIQVASVVMVSGCVGEDGTFVISNVIVIAQLQQLPSIDSNFSDWSNNTDDKDKDHHDEDDDHDD